MLDLTPLKDALLQLETSLGYAASELAAKDAGLAKQFRAASIQAFEYTYELSTKMLKRQLEDMESPPAVEALGMRDLLRLGAEKGLIADPQAWFSFREKRNITAHSYNERKAEEIFAALPEFAKHAKDLLAQLARLNA